MKEKNPHPVFVRFILFLVLSLYIYASYFVFAVVQFDLWLLVKRKGPIHKLVRLLTVTLGLLFLVACFLGAQCGPSSYVPVEPARPECLGPEELNKLIEQHAKPLTKEEQTRLMEEYFAQSSQRLERLVAALVDPFNEALAASDEKFRALKKTNEAAVRSVVQENDQVSRETLALEFERLVSASLANEKDGTLGAIACDLHRREREFKAEQQTLYLKLEQLKTHFSDTARLVRQQATALHGGMEELNRTWHETRPNVLVTEEAIKQLIGETAAEYFQEHGLSETTEERMRAIIQEKLYQLSADGLVSEPDFALGSAGGAVVAVDVPVPILPDTEVAFSNDEQRIAREMPREYKAVLGMPLSDSDRAASVLPAWFYPKRHASSASSAKAFHVLQPDTTLGSCWPFIGSRANITIRLACPVAVTSVTIDHVHPKIDPNHGRTALKDFKVVGFPVASPKESIEILAASYDANARTPQQFRATYPALGDGQAPLIQLLQVQILSNHNAAFTCLYRVRVHASNGCQKLN